MRFLRTHMRVWSRPCVGGPAHMQGWSSAWWNVIDLAVDSELQRQQINKSAAPALRFTMLSLANISPAATCGKFLHQVFSFNYFEFSTRLTLLMAVFAACTLRRFSRPGSAGCIPNTFGNV